MNESSLGSLGSLESLESLGFSWPSPAYLFGAVVFGAIGYGAWRYGRRTGRRRMPWYGVALMLYPYAVSRTWMLYAVGIALCAALWFDRA